MPLTDLRPAPKPMAGKKKRKCLICKNSFQPSRTLQNVCGFICALKKAKLDREKKERIEKRKGLEALKPLSEHLKEARAVVNAYIRERDRDLPCISCGKYHTGKYDAGHYRSVGAAPQLQFHEDNIHKQCVPCNQHKSGSAVEYRINLVKKIGLARVEALENNNEVRKYTIEDAKRIKKEYREKLKSLRSLSSGK